VGARAFAGGSSLFWTLVFMGVVDLAVPIQETPGFYESYLLETGWGVLYTLLVGAAFVSLAVRPGMVMPLTQVGIVAVCVAVTAVAAGSWIQLVPGLLLGLNCYVFLRLGRYRRVRGNWYPPRLDPLVGALALGLVPLGVLFAVDMVNGFREGRPPLDDDTWYIDHWPMQAAFALAAAGVAVAVAAGVRNRSSGTAVSAGCVAVAVGWFGYWSATYPNHAGSAGEAGGTGLIGWAAAFVVVVAWRLARRRTPSPR